jgi:hypothetical protein
LESLSVRHPALLSSLVLTSLSAPIAIIISLIVKRAETAVIAVPTVIFLGLLPGLLYYDLVGLNPRLVSLVVRPMMFKEEEMLKSCSVSSLRALVS